MSAPHTTPRTVMVFGVFDILHPGHVRFLEDAKSHGDVLVVVVTPDAKAEQEKGRRPLLRLDDRIRMLGALRVVDRAIPGDEGDHWSVVTTERPHVICVGHDQRADHPSFLEQIDGLPTPPSIVRLAAEDPDRNASSRIRSLARE